MRAPIGWANAENAWSRSQSPATLRGARPLHDIRGPRRPKEPPVNKQEIVDVVAKRLGVTRARAAEITDLFFSQGGIIASELKRGGRVAISGFGHFELRRRAARAVR